MRCALYSLVALWTLGGAVAARAGVVTTTLVTSTSLIPTTTFVTTTSLVASSTLVVTTSLVTSTTLTSSSTNTSISTSTSTSSSTIPWPITECRSDCQAAFDSALPALIDGTECPDAEWIEFVDCWSAWGEAYHGCVGGTAATCSDFKNGCMRVAERNPGLCSALHECVSCCASTLNGGRRACRRTLLRGLEDEERDGCRAALRRVTSAQRDLRRCRRDCKRDDRCGIRAWGACVDRVRKVDACYASCVGRCDGDRLALDLCLDACRNIGCDALERVCTVGGDDAGPYETACGRCETSGRGECRDTAECVQATSTTSTSSSTTTSLGSTTTSTSSTTTFTIALQR